MVTKNDIQYERELHENVSSSDLEKWYKDKILIWITSSGGEDQRSGSFKILLQFNEKYKYFEKKVPGTTVNQAAIEGLRMAVSKINKSERVYFITANAIGIEKAFSGKGMNGERLHSVLEDLKAKHVFLTEVYCPGSSDTIISHIVNNSGIQERVRQYEDKKNNRQEQVIKYTDRVKKDTIEKIITILIEEKVDKKVIDRVKELE